MYEFQICVFGSGSKGNCTYYEPNGDGNGFLIDIGFPDKRIEHGLGCIGKSMDNVSQVLISHEHGDHLPKSKVGAYGIDTAFTAPDAGSPSSQIQLPYSWWELSLEKYNHDQNFYVRRFPLVHDAICYGFLIESSDKTRVAHVTDTGEIPDEALKLLVNLHALVIEANWDGLLIDDMINDENIPRGRVEHSMDDHLSNQQMADLVETVAWSGLEYIVLIHLSESNNNPELARQAAENALGEFSVEKGGQCKVVVSGQDKATPLIILKGEE